MPLKLIPPRQGKTPYYAVRGTYLGRYVDRSTRTGAKPLAAKMLREWQRQIERGEFSARGDPTFADAALAYMQAGGERRFMTPLLEHFGRIPLAQVDQAAIDKAALTLYPLASPATRNRQVYSPVSAALKRAGIEISMKRPKGAQGRRLAGWLWPEQAFALFDQARLLDPEFALLLVLLTYCPLRLAEPLAMRCDDVRIDDAFAYVPDSKNGEPRPIHLPPFVRAQLRTHPRGIARKGERLFRFHKGGHIYSLLRAAAFKAGITLPERQAFHILSHTYGTWMRRFGGLDDIGLIATGRWKDRDSVERYAHAVVAEEARQADVLPVPRRGKAGGRIRGVRRKHAATH